MELMQAAPLCRLFAASFGIHSIFEYSFIYDRFQAFGMKQTLVARLEFETVSSISVPHFLFFVAQLRKAIICITILASPFNKQVANRI